MDNKTQLKTGNIPFSPSGESERGWKLAMNARRKPNRGRAFERTLEDYDSLTREQWLKDMVDKIRAGDESLKAELPFRCPHYYHFKDDDHRCQAAIDEEAFTYQTTVDIDDLSMVDKAITRAYELDQDEASIWAHKLLHMDYSARNKLHIDVRMPKGKTIAETQQEYCEALGIPYDESCVTPERFIYITDERQEIYRSDDWYKVLTEEEKEEYRKAWEARETLSPGPSPVKRARGVSTSKDMPLGFSSPSTDSSSEVSTSSSPRGGWEGATFRGIPYSEIISALLMQMGYDNEPSEGERNMALYSLVREVRYICDFNADKIFNVIPKWGLPDSEVKATILSALNSVRKSEMPHNLKNIIDRLGKEYDAQGNATDSKDARVELPKRLPRLLALLLKAFPEEYRPAVLVSAMVFLGTLMTRLRSYYMDGSTQSPSFEACIIAPQASGKSFTRRLYDIITEPIAAADKLAREVDKKYQEERKKAKNEKKQPEDPKAIIRLIPATASNAMILKRADYANAQHLLTYAEEIDTLVKGNKAGAWSQKSDIYRMAYDNATWGQDYMSDNSYSGQVKLYYNILCCGTPHALKRFFNDVEDGLVSRFIFAKLPDMLGTKIPHFGVFSHKEREEIRETVWKIYEEQTLTPNPSPVIRERGVDTSEGASSEPTETNQLPSPINGEGPGLGSVGAAFDEERDGIWINSKRLTKCIDDWLEEKRLQFLESQSNKALEVFRRRAAVTGYRAGMVAWMLCGKQMSTVALDLAIWFAEYTLAQQLALFGEQMNAIMNEEEDATESYSAIRNGHNIQIFSLLPDTFTKEDVVKLRQSIGQGSNIRMVISRWFKSGLIEKISEGVWHKK